MAAPTSIFSRKLDMVYVVWFVLHLVIMFAVDLVPLYPAPLQPKALLDLRQWYIVTYHDRFFTEPPAWFTMFAWMEAFYHVPLSLWAIGALIRGELAQAAVALHFAAYIFLAVVYELWFDKQADDPQVPVQILIWAVQTAITTATCVVDFMSWNGLSAEERNGLLGLYAPYCVLAVLIGGDMISRLQSALQQPGKTKKS